MNNKRKYIEENLEIIKGMIAKNRPKFEIARVLGVKYETLNKHLKDLGIDYKGNPNRKGVSHSETKTPVSLYLSGEKNITASKLRNKLIDEGLKEYKCEKCGRTEWEGRPIPLELHHINMDHNDNRLENLQILCSNCHSLAHDYCNMKGKGNSSVNFDLLEKYLDNNGAGQEYPKSKKEKIVKYCKVCGKELTGRGQTKYCSQKCAHIDMSKIPSKDILKDKLDDFKWNKTKTGKYFGVSDNTIKKWIKVYNLTK